MSCPRFVSVASLTRPDPGPFELTKIAAQLPTEPDNSRKGAVNPLDEKVKASYKGKGTFGVMGALIKNRGPTGLYAGVTYQLGALSWCSSTRYTIF